MIAASLLVGCSSSALVARTAVDDTAPATVTEPTAAPPTDASTSTSTTTPPPALPVLLGDGIGTHRFGDDSTDVMFGLTSALGSASSDELTWYEPTDWGGFETHDGERQFIAPLGRSACWGMGLCLFFGGETTDSMTLVGWRYSSDFPGILSSPAGATVQASGADIVGLQVGTGGCFTVGPGTVDGIDLQLLSTGEPFGGWDANGNWFDGHPAAADVTVMSMEAGDSPVYVYADC